MYKVDLNCDLGESFGHYKLGLDEEVIKYISSANIACGFHASDPIIMEKTVKLAMNNNVSIGAHPGFPDLLGFGRRNMNILPHEAKAYVKYQIGALYSFCKGANVPLVHVKPHGALYNMAAKDYNLARAICEAIYEFDSNLILMALAGSEMVKAAQYIGLKVVQEVFADRAYEEDGSLVARTKDGAIITDEKIAINRVIRMIKEGKVEAITGRDIDIEVDTICVHGDGEKALDFVKLIRKTLEESGIEINNIR